MIDAIKAGEMGRLNGQPSWDTARLGPGEWFKMESESIRGVEVHWMEDLESGIQTEFKAVLNTVEGQLRIAEEEISTIILPVVGTMSSVLVVPYGPALNVQPFGYCAAPCSL